MTPRPRSRSTLVIKPLNISVMSMGEMVGVELVPGGEVVGVCTETGEFLPKSTKKCLLGWTETVILWKTMVDSWS